MLDVYKLKTDITEDTIYPRQVDYKVYTNFVDCSWELPLLFGERGSIKTKISYKDKSLTVENDSSFFKYRIKDLEHGKKYDILFQKVFKDGSLSEGTTIEVDIPPLSNSKIGLEYISENYLEDINRDYEYEYPRIPRTTKFSKNVKRDKHYYNEPILKAIENKDLETFKELAIKDDNLTKKYMIEDDWDMSYVSYNLIDFCALRGFYEGFIYTRIILSKIII